MQDKFVGDIGDFGKYGLLRALVGEGPQDEPRCCLGVVWYMWEDSDLLYDAKLAYLSQPDEFRRCDKNLFDVLGRMVHDRRRTVEEVRKSEILGRDGTDVVFFAEPVPNRRTRGDWLLRALKKTEKAQIVFLDPDKGLPTREREARPERSRSYAYRNEMRRFVERGQTVVIYQSYWRINKGDTPETEVFKWRHERLTEVHLDEHPRVVGTGDRAFVVLPAARHVEHIDRRLATFVERWGEHFKHREL